MARRARSGAGLPPRQLGVLCGIACSWYQLGLGLGLGLRLRLTLLLGLLPFGTLAAGPAPLVETLPPEVSRALQRAHVPPQALVVYVQDAEQGHPLLSWQPDQAVNPASLAKLLTTVAALDQLGPAWTWTTPVWLQGPIDQGVLDGSLVIKGSGDPKLVMEQLWLLLRRVQQAGVREIRGDIVLDNADFAPPSSPAAEFDGDVARPYNVQADALLLNFKSVTYRFVPDPAQGVARVLVEPPLAGQRVDRTVPLADGACGDWRSALKATFEGTARVRFEGRYPGRCGERLWPVADSEPATFNARLMAGLWQEMGGRLRGRVRDGVAPTHMAPSFEWRSPPLLDVVRDINKYSNNVMAQQLFLSMALQQDPTRPATEDAARENLRQWLRQRLGDATETWVVDNGSGLSREGRASARGLARLLQFAHDGPWAAELASSLPVAGLDGTLRRASLGVGQAHLKTGSLRDVAGVAGYVRSGKGRRSIVVAVINHPQAQAARPALEAVVQWATRDATDR
jgi:serine-type D-Ala-D-Ala carboxypeptidase/endopeptidase (penicillin-binding protein 4)